MRKKTISFLLALMLLCSISVFASADPLTGTVIFNPNETLRTDKFNDPQWDYDREPGDTVTYSVIIRNRHSRLTRWYMSNDVLRSLEESENGSRVDGITGGAYSYTLTYTGPNSRRSRTLYDSKNKESGYVGGDNIGGESGVPVGLHEATSNLKDYFFLDSLNGGESGTVTLTITLEGETLGNSYQETAAKVLMGFAVELTGKRTTVKTGDTNNLLPYYIGMIAAGLLFLYLALDALTDRLYKKGKG